MTDYNVLSSRQINRIRNRLTSEQLLLEDGEVEFFFSIAPAADVVIEFRKARDDNEIDILFIYDRDVETPNADNFKDLDKRTRVVVNDIETALYDILGEHLNIQWTDKISNRPYKTRTTIPFDSDSFLPDHEEIDVSIVGGPPVTINIPTTRLEASEEHVREFIEDIWWEHLDAETKLEYIALHDIEADEYEIEPEE